MKSDLKITVRIDASQYHREIRRAHLALFRFHGWRRFLMPDYWRVLLFDARKTTDRKFFQ